MNIGVLALQGGFVEHIRILRALDAAAVEVRMPGDLEGLDGLILPGGESTAILKLLDFYGLIAPLRSFARRRALWGTCAGMILMANRIETDQPRLNLMNITVTRNAFGRQIDSFQQPVTSVLLAEGEHSPFPGVFIRAPGLAEVRAPAEVIARLPDGTPVGALQGRWMATSFHPELTGDFRFHRCFLDLVGGDLPQCAKKAPPG